MDSFDLMTQARLSVTLPEGVWITDVSTAHPEVTSRVLAAMPGEDAGFGLRFEVEYVHERIETERLLSKRQRETLLAAV